MRAGCVAQGQLGVVEGPSEQTAGPPDEGVGVRRTDGAVPHISVYGGQEGRAADLAPGIAAPVQGQYRQFGPGLRQPGVLPIDDGVPCSCTITFLGARSP